MDVITGIAFPQLFNDSLKTKKGELSLKIDPETSLYFVQFNYIPNCPLIEYIANSNDSNFIKNNVNFILSIERIWIG